MEIKVLTLKIIILGVESHNRRTKYILSLAEEETGHLQTARINFIDSLLTSHSLAYFSLCANNRTYYKGKLAMQEIWRRETLAYPHVSLLSAAFYF